MYPSSSPLIRLIILFITFSNISCTEDGYLRYVKDGCFLRGEALSCVKYKALKLAKRTLFGDNMNTNETIKANHMISFVPLDQETLDKLEVKKEEVDLSEPRGFFSEWAEVTKYAVKLVKEFFRVKGIKVKLPEGARTVEEDDVDDGLPTIGSNQTERGTSELNGMVEESSVRRPFTSQSLTQTRRKGRGRKKKLAVVVPLLTLLAALKTKLLLIPILLSVLLIKKLLLIAALLLPGLLSTLKACKHHHPMTHYSYFGSSDSNDFNSDYGSSYAYSSGNGYGKDWASNRAYSMPKPRPTPSPVYITAPGGAV
ncbi:uncharacterized protein isoform X1 [Choristoneura fumiferana]|uniref:uncharacterized protein isoform X1 n=1 Tax=Choristoneura fumiferana TaxID=7141 RepID=UPI003D15C5AD